MQARLRVGATRGGARKDPRRPCCAARGISVSSPRGRLIPHPQITGSPHSTATPPPPAYPRPWLCSRDPSVPPASLRAHRACALRSCPLSSAEAAAASPLRSHGVSNRSPLPLQPPFPPFRSSRPSRPSLGGVGRLRNHGRAGAEEGRRAVSRDRACALGRVRSSRQLVFKEESHVRVRLRTSSQTRWLPPIPALTVCERLLMRSCPPEAVFFLRKGRSLSSRTCALVSRRAVA